MSRPEFEDGHWFAVFYRDDCSRCKREISDFRQFLLDRSAPKLRRDIRHNFVFVRVPPFQSGTDIKRSLMADMDIDVADIAFAQLPTDQEWFVQVPLIVEIGQGTVKSIQRDSLVGVFFTTLTAGNRR